MKKKYGIEVKDEELAMVHRIGFKVSNLPCQKTVLAKLLYFIFPPGIQASGRASVSPHPLRVPANPFRERGRAERCQGIAFTPFFKKKMLAEIVVQSCLSHLTFSILF